jgi:hypothetical protein
MSRNRLPNRRASENFSYRAPATDQREFWKLCAAADRAFRRMPRPSGRALPDGWETMSVGRLWDALNDPARFATPDSTIDAVLYCVRKRGIAALKEPANINRLKRCDEAARATIDRRIAALVAKGLL